MTFKEVRLSPKIGVGDFDTKVNRAIEFLEDGDRIKVTVRFRGRELTHPEIGRNLLARFVERVKDHGVAERTPLLEGKSMHITMASLHKPKVTSRPQAAVDDAGDARTRKRQRWQDRREPDRPKASTSSRLRRRPTPTQPSTEAASAKAPTARRGTGRRRETERPAPEPAPQESEATCRR